ncbi:uncharacterized protein VTP21DRAFT_1100 [Calcarisporiella thermophila]|uniref:uncharacterized protein n=1 Tax=Calcarisporiella thermophila TaxID=911321 RepID=UPI00374408CB
MPFQCRLFISACMDVVKFEPEKNSFVKLSKQFQCKTYESSKRVHMQFWENTSHSQHHSFEAANNDESQRLILNHDIIYEGTRAITGPFLAKIGRYQSLIYLSNRNGKHYALLIAEYAITIVSMPFLSVVDTLWQAVVLVIAERFGKTVQSLSRDTVLAQAGSNLGLGRAFAYHESLDESGALFGPLIVASMIALSGYRLAFIVLAIRDTCITDGIVKEFENIRPK